MNNKLPTLDMMMSSKEVSYENIDTLIWMNKNKQLFRYLQSKEMQEKNTFSSNFQDSVLTAIIHQRLC